MRIDITNTAEDHSPCSSIVSPELISKEWSEFIETYSALSAHLILFIIVSVVLVIIMLSYQEYRSKSSRSSIYPDEKSKYVEEKKPILPTYPTSFHAAPPLDNSHILNMQRQSHTSADTSNSIFAPIPHARYTNHTCTL
ncbi:hypothetical protein K7432_015405 [Basidiobolus ranarum]|uniref:Uncharacterized protein n=1 Tax=Basidiobolus ranarum TaxID=34480 RepID=A0ABR2WG74_9FUNG